MELPSDEPRDEVRTIWYHDPVTNQESLFTKYQVFFICFIIPSIIFWLPAALPANNGSELVPSTSALMELLLFILLPLSVFVPTNVIGGEFKKYGYYGALTSIGVSLLIFVTYTNGLYF